MLIDNTPEHSTARGIVLAALISLGIWVVIALVLMGL
jgi:hypothetical protein